LVVVFWGGGVLGCGFCFGGGLGFFVGLGGGLFGGGWVVCCFCVGFFFVGVCKASLGNGIVKTITEETVSPKERREYRRRVKMRGHRKKAAPSFGTFMPETENKNCLGGVGKHEGADFGKYCTDTADLIAGERDGD